MRKMAPFVKHVFECDSFCMGSCAVSAELTSNVFRKVAENRGILAGLPILCQFLGDSLNFDAFALAGNQSRKTVEAPHKMLMSEA